MRTPTEVELEHAYDPVKAREYYLRTRELKGRRKAGLAVATPRTRSSQDPRTGLNREQIAKNARTRQRKELQDRIDSLSGKLQKLEAVIRKREREEASEDRKGKAKKERAAKESNKPKTAAEKAEAARDAEKYRDKNQQKLKTKAKNAREESSNSSGGDSSSGKKKSSKTASVSDLKALATKVKGQIAVAKQKLAAL